MHARRESTGPVFRHSTRRPPPAPEQADFLQDLQRKVGNAAVAELVARTRNPAAHAPVGSPAQSLVPGCLAAQPEARSEPRTAVQRYAFVNDKKIEPKQPGLSKTQKKFAGDDTVRDYHNEAEFKKHAEGATDYLGTLPEPSQGTWVRFSSTGTNVIGENHAEVTLDHVIKAVGAKPGTFIYEGFASDDLSTFPNMDKSYQKSADPMRKKFDLPKGDLSRHGGESIFPKLAQALNILRERLEAGNIGILDDRMGEILQRSLKLAWKYGKDVSSEPDPGIAPERREIIAVHQREKGLAKFVAGFKEGRSIAKEKDLTENREPIMAYIKAFINDIWAARGNERVEGSSDPEYTKAERFRKQRDELLQERAIWAAGSAYRYVGMGNDHVTTFEKSKPVGPFHFYDMSGATHDEFVARTKELRARAES